MTRHPLRSRAFLASLATAILGALVLSGLVDVEQASRIEQVVGLFITAGIASGLVVITGEPKVTPVEDPRAGDGTPLVRQPAATRYVITSDPSDAVVDAPTAAEQAQPRRSDPGRSDR